MIFNAARITAADRRLGGETQSRAGTPSMAVVACNDEGRFSNGSMWMSETRATRSGLGGGMRFRGG